MPIYLLLLFFAGFTGDKLLKYVSDKVTSRLFSEEVEGREELKQGYEGKVFVMFQAH